MCLCGIIIRNAKLTQQRLTRRYRQRDMIYADAFPCSSRLLPMPYVVIRGHYKFLFLSLFGSPMATQFIFGVRGMRKIVQRYKKIMNYPNFPKGKCENQYFLLLVSLLYERKMLLILTSTRVTSGTTCMFPRPVTAMIFSVSMISSPFV